MSCGTCGHVSRPEARFCEACGGSLARTCTSCGAELTAGARFCGACGHTTAASTAASDATVPQSYTPTHLAQRILRQRSSLEGERKRVAVLFADVIGFTPISERTDPEQMHGIMERFFDVLLAEVHRFEGTVNQFTGDGIMALFGAPLALEDAPRRAVMAAVAMQQAVERLRQELLTTTGLDFRMRVGVHTGLVVVGKIGNDLRMDYTAVGDTTNLAARLQALAPAGSTLISEATHRLVAGFFDTRDCGELAIKGRSAPVRAYEVLADRAERRRIDVLAAVGLTPLAGRERELSALREAFAAASAGQGQVVFLVGDAGIGKSRLLFEFRREFEQQPHLWFEGRCASYGKATAFLPIIDGLRRYFRIDDRDDEAAAVHKIDESIGLLGGDLAWTLPFVRQLLALPMGDEAAQALDAASRRAQTFGALKAILLQAAKLRPLVLVVEDLHWIDPASEEFLAFLGDATPTSCVFAIFSHRPGYRHPFGDRSYHLRVSLRPLSPAETAGMTAALLGSVDLPDSVREFVGRKAEGNPFFVEEVTKSLLEQGALRSESGHLVLPHALREVAVPDTIQGVLAARIDRLADAPKRAIQIASVIGREFALRLLERIAESGEGLRGHLEELRALELVYEKAMHPELAYMFKHALTHDVAYESVLIDRRKYLHRTIGLAIEELYADRLTEHFETLALHFERGEDWERALKYHALAAEKAEAAYATHAVVHHCRQALAITERLGSGVDDEQRRRLEDKLGLAHFYLSEFHDSADAYLRAARLSRDPTLEGTHLAFSGHSDTWGHRYASARSSIDAALALARRDGIPGLEALALCMDGFYVSAVDGQIDGHEQRGLSALELAKQAGSEEAVTLANFLLCQCSEWTGRYRNSIAFGTDALEAARRLRLAHVLVWTMWFMGKAACCLGDYGRAVHWLGEAHAITERIGDRAWRTRLLNTLGWCYTELGDETRAREYNKRACALAKEIGDPEIIANAEINLALNDLALGEYNRAGDALVNLYEQAEARTDPWMRWRYRLHIAHGLGRVALARGDPEGALLQAERELAGALSHRAPKIEARALTLRGAALLLEDRRDEAEAVLSQAVALADRIENPRASWSLLALLADIERRRGRGDRALAHTAQAHALRDRVAASLPDDALRRSLWTDFEVRAQAAIGQKSTDG
jgi:class 3 adenylate cyclase/tetratricopeptide (TPR) repeat protein